MAAPCGLGIGHQGFAQRDVELHRASVGGARAGGGHQHSAGGRSPGRVEGIQPLGYVLGQAQADGGADLGAEVAQLLHGLVGAGAEQLVGPVGREHDQRHPGVVGFHYRGAEVGHRGARSHRHTHRRACTDSQPDGQVAGGAFVDADVQPDAAGSVGVLQRECQRRVSRARGTAPRRGRRRGSARQRRRGPVSSRGSPVQSVTARGRGATP